MFSRKYLLFASILFETSLKTIIDKKNEQIKILFFDHTLIIKLKPMV
jgi:hypothetical protein